LQAVATALLDVDGMSAWNWLARSGASIPIGTPIMASVECRDALIALSKTINATEFEVVGRRESTTLRYANGYVELAIAPGLAAELLVEREERRIERRRASGHYRDPSLPVVYFCAGQRGELPTSATKSDLVDEGDPASVAVGPASARPLWIAVESLLQGRQYDVP
jgi:hypothetical protein